MIDTRFWVSLILGYWYHGIIDTRFWVSLILGYWYHGIIDTRFWVSLILGYWYQGIIDTWFWVSLILGSGYHWYSVLGIIDTWILVSGYHWYSVWGIIDTRFWVSLILGYWYLGIIDTRLWVSLILRYWYLGIIDTRVGYLRLCMQYVKITLGWLTHKTSQAPHFFSPAKLTCILHPSTSAHPLERAWRRNANASMPPLNWLYSSGRSLLAPHEEDSKSFGSSACCLGDTPWVLPQPPWGDSPSLPGHPISFQLVPPSGCTTAQPARWPHPHLSDLLWRHFAVSSPRRASCPHADVAVLQHLLYLIVGKNLVQRPEVVSLLCHLLDHRCEVFERQRSHHNQIWHVKPFGDDVGHSRHADLQNELARGIVVGDVASEGTEGGSNVITGIPTIVSAAFGCELQVYHDGTACSVLARLVHLFQHILHLFWVVSRQIYCLQCFGQRFIEFQVLTRTDWHLEREHPFAILHMLTHEIVQHGWFPNALGTTDHQEGRGAQSFTLRWIDEVLDVFLLDRPCRGGLCPFQPLPSLPHCPVHEEARKEPLNESLENQHYDAPCAQQSPTSFNGLRRKSPCGLCSCMTAWKDEPAWRKLIVQAGFGIEGCLICKTKQEPQRLTSINTWIWSKSFDIFEQQLGRVWTWTYT